ncbi:MAG: hypothetical protein IAE86_05360 [Burkholderiaceae bacterium]|nr:hypothetical protein [Burkholderiaceae bacterium]
MIDRDAELPIKRLAQLLGISRGSVYYHPEPIPQAELALMHRIDELHLEHPFAGSRMLRDLLRLEGVEVGPAARGHADAAHGHAGAVPHEPAPIQWTPRSAMSVIHGRTVRSLATNREPASVGNAVPRRREAFVVFESSLSAHCLNDASRFERLTSRMLPAMSGDGYPTTLMTGAPSTRCARPMPADQQVADLHHRAANFTSMDQQPTWWS